MATCFGNSCSLVYRACLSLSLIYLCLCVCVCVCPFAIEGGIFHLILLPPEHPSFYFSIFFIRKNKRNYSYG